MSEPLPNDTNDPIVPSDKPAPSWWISEDQPGAGDRPEWLSEKFKTVKDMATSYVELEKKVVLEAPPEDYDLSNSRYLDGDFESFKDLKALAKEKRVPQVVIDKMLESVDKYMDEFSTDFKAEAEKLGPDGKERLEVLDNWTKGLLDNESYEALTSRITSAESIKALEQLRGKMMENSTTIPSGNDSASSNTIDMADVQSELNANLEKYKTDPHYRRELQKKMEVASKGSNFVDKNAV